jgi:tetratricopeptide (TPR) repeat protein
VALGAIALVAYLPALRNGFIWDDNDYVTENLVLRSVDGLRRLWLDPQSVPQYYPVTFTSFWLDYHLWGLEPFGYHLVNILLHAASAVLLWRVLAQLGIRGAWMAAALFAVHPMQVESVAWVTERKNVLSGLFFFAAFLMYLRAETPELVAGTVRIRWQPYLASLALFVGALLAKSVTCSLPAVLLLVFWWQRGTLDRRTVLRLLPMFAVGLVMAAVTAWMERYHVLTDVLTEGPEFSQSLVERVLIAGRALWFYPRTLIWPRGLAFMYPRWTIDARAWWQYAFPAAAAAVIAALYVARHRIGRGPFVAALCYIGALTPALGFIDVYPMRYSFVADHFAYLPIVALIVMLPTAGLRMMDFLPDRSRRAVALSVGAAVLLVLGAATASYARSFQDMRTLWTDSLASNPESWLAHNNLGRILDDDRNIEGATAEFLESLRVHPSPEAHTNLGIVLARQGRHDEAAGHYRAALALSPRFAAAHMNLGIVLRDQGRVDEAIAEFREAFRPPYTFIEARYALALLLGGRGNLDEAIAQFSEVVKAEPNRTDAQYNLGVALQKVGRLEEAMARYRETLRLEPENANAHNNLGVALRQTGRLDEAIAEFTEAVRLRPSSDQAQSNLRAALAARGGTRPTTP